MAIRLPVPDYLDKWNFLLYYAFNQCPVNKTMYVQTALPVAGEMALVLLGADIGDYMWALGRPKHSRSSRHGRRGKRGRKSWRGIPEVADLVADRLDPEGYWRSPRPLGAATWLFELGEVADRAIYTFLLLEFAVDLPYMSVLGVIRAPKVHCPNVPYLERSAPIGTYGPGTPNWIATNMYDQDAINLWWSPNGFGAACSEAVAAYTWQFTVNSPFDDTDFEARLWADWAGGYAIEEQKNIHLTRNEPLTLTLGGRAPQGANVQWHVKTSTNYVQLTHATLIGLPLMF